MPGGSHNRKSNESLSHALNSKGKFKLCKCPLHRNNGMGTKVTLTKFKRHTKAGVQGMCADGKTLIDSFSHTLKRLQLLATVDLKTAINILENFDERYSVLIDSIKNIILKTYTEQLQNFDTENIFRLKLLTKLDEKLKTNVTGYYDVDLSNIDKIKFNKLLQSYFTKEILENMRATQAIWTVGHLVKDSKDGKLYPVEEFGFNVSKKRELYDALGKITPYRVNVHNTKAKGQRSSTLRGERYLADGEYTEANRTMKLLGNANKNIHADHLIPLALGGIHDSKNLVALDGKENIYKKDKLTDEAFKLLKTDISLLSHWHHKIFLESINEPKEIVWQYLNKSVHNLIENTINLSNAKKIKFIASVYPYYKESQIIRIIKKHFTKK